jgi:hypothetical protein
MRRFLQLIAKGVCKPTERPDNYTVDCGCTKSCKIYISDYQVYTGGIVMECYEELIRQVPPVLLDGTGAGTGFRCGGARECPWCCSWSMYNESHPYVCRNCVTSFTAEYDSTCYRMWLCAQLTYWDIARKVGQLMASV